MSPRSKKLIARLALISPGLIATAAWRYVEARHRMASSPTPSDMLHWWLTIAAFGTSVFLFFAVPICVAFRRLLPTAVLVSSVYNLFMVSMLFSLFFISSDEAAEAALATIGLRLLGWIVVLPIAILWAIAFAYQFGTTVDSFNRSKQPSPIKRDLS